MASKSAYKNKNYNLETLMELRATRVNMQHRKLVNNSNCPCCGVGAETMDHLFCECPRSLPSTLPLNAD